MPMVADHPSRIKLSQAPLFVNTRSNFLKKLDRNLVVENIYATGDHHHGQLWGGAPVWLSGLATPANPKKREQRDPKSKSEEFTLPNLPGVTTTPVKPKKKSLPEIELPHSTEISPRAQSSTSQSSSPSKTDY
ncbi:unnamed protein product [Acanthoscelides obtectus]|uniref:Uncharacterized protein n=1 Tax=Acanthoscelides obtectus TaxID=200917 RepID=A0A9P0KKS2_ACAOB|nr:unnamed protein product [Acanthoscelides obtectus]CAK1651043.1 hypothetical protein AOBTE_LOCUS17027 [Acanthoscelides obtectus]